MNLPSFRSGFCRFQRALLGCRCFSPVAGLRAAARARRQMSAIRPHVPLDKLRAFLARGARGCPPPASARTAFLAPVRHRFGLLGPKNTGLLAVLTLVVFATPSAAQEGPTQPPEPPPKEVAKPPPRAEPASVTAATPACREHGDKFGDAFDRVVKPLIDEANRRDEKTLDAGMAAFEAVLLSEKPALGALRASAAALHATLTTEQRAACEEYAYRRIARSFARFGPAAGTYSGRVGIFRALGGVFVF